MRIAYFDCLSGIAGDMTLAALVDAGADLQAIQAAVASLGLPSVNITADEVRRKGFRGIKIQIEYEPQPQHRHLHQITAMIEAGQLTAHAKELAKRIFTRLGEAEATVHGVEIRKVHFHEVGAIDSIADIVGTAVALDQLNIDYLEASPVPTGYGFVEIAHGRCSIPAPATGELLKGIPIAASNVEAELTTPTGAAILASLAAAFGPPPPMTIEAIGYGAGTKELEQQPNLLRVLIGEAANSANMTRSETLCLLETNLDDATGEIIGHAAEKLLQNGALDVYTTNIHMKKNRPAVMLSVLCETADAERLERILFAETTTLGIRRTTVARRKLPRQPREVQTLWGPVAGVLAALPDGQQKFSPEYESCRQVAQSKNLPLRSVYNAAQAAFISATPD
ncbi:MAG: nickel pincer cofactor biosynthesis protein LarC [Pirellulales bacterium]|nr:nickel pincer cofactor biosynthesis protein LarC [Pirellulales bacterium]